MELEIEEVRKVTEAIQKEEAEYRNLVQVKSPRSATILILLPAPVLCLSPTPVTQAMLHTHSLPRGLYACSMSVVVIFSRSVSSLLPPPFPFVLDISGSNVFI